MENFGLILADMNNIYDHIADETSKMIWKNRLLYSITGEYDCLLNAALTNENLKPIIEEMQDGRFCLWGYGACGKWIHKLLGTHVSCIVDSNPELWGRSSNGITILSPKDFVASCINEPIVVSSEFYFSEIISQIRELGSNNRIINVGEVLKKSFDDQYFDMKELTYHAPEILADVGAFDGRSSKAFIKFAGNAFEKIYCFEPDRRNREVIADHLKSEIMTNEVEILPYAAWSDSVKVSFFSGEGDSSRILQKVPMKEKNEMITAIKLDDVYKNMPVTFIKMDIEGAELEALKGAEHTIKKQKPKLAICVYHKPEDIIEIPRLILSYNPDYTFYLRHYSISWAETVLFAV